MVDEPQVDPDISAMLAEVAARIRAVRLGRGMSQRELGERLGVSQAAVSNWESTRRTVTIENLIDLARVLGVEPAELLPEEPPAPAPEQPPLTDAERAAAALFARSCIHPAGEACTECDARARELVAAVTPAILAACPDCVTSEGELLAIAAIVNVVRYGRSPFSAPALVQGSLSWEVAKAISRGRPRGLAGTDPALIDHAIEDAREAAAAPETPADGPRELLPRRDIPARNVVNGAYIA